MGYMRHHGMMIMGNETSVTTHYLNALDLLEELNANEHYAMKIPMIISELSKRLINGYAAFSVFPDGSKEGWRPSDQADKFRSDLCDLLDADSRVDYVYFLFGDEMGDCKILSHSNEWMAREEEPLWG